eukprot:3457968-Karenia_brevis.AAC.1
MLLLALAQWIPNDMCDSVEAEVRGLTMASDSLHHLVVSRRFTVEDAQRIGTNLQNRPAAKERKKDDDADDDGDDDDD